MGWNIRGAINHETRLMQPLLDLSADIVVSEIKPLTRVALIDGGTLRSGTRWRKLSKTARRIFNNVEYAIFWEFGTKYLHGKKGIGFMRHGLRKAIPKINRLL